MAGIRFSDVLRLVAASDEPADHLRKLFEWQIERAMVVIRAMTAAVVAMAAALVAALLSGESIADWLLALVVVSAVLGLAYSRSRYEQARALEAEYVVALNVLRELGPLAPLVRLYPQLYDD